MFLMITKSIACPTFYFHINFTGTRTFHIENMSNPSNYIDVTGTNSIDAWNFNTGLAQPCGMTFGSNICYSIYEITAHVTGDEKIAVQFNGTNPNHLTLNYDGLSRTFSVSNPGNLSAYTLSWGNDTDNPPICSSTSCHYDYFILDNYIFQFDGIPQTPPTILPTGFTNSYTNSETYIYIANTSIPLGSDVTLDANPLTDGYVLIDIGFETQPNSNFLAVVVTPCSLLANEEFVDSKSFIAYPNPVTSILNIESLSIIKSISIMDVNGRIIFQNENDSDAMTVNTEMLSSGMYLLKVTTDSGTSIEKIVKK